MKTRALLLLLLLVAPVACSDDSGPPPPPSLADTWTGALTGDAPADITLHLIGEDGGTVQGNGTFTVGATSIVVNVVTGVYTHPNVSFTLRGQGFDDFVYTGAFQGDDLIDGVLNGSGFTDDVVVLFRQ